MIFALRPNARVKPTCVVEPKPWQAFSAMALVERSKFGLNELLGPMVRDPQPMDERLKDDAESNEGSAGDKRKCHKPDATHLHGPIMLGGAVLLHELLAVLRIITRLRNEIGRASGRERGGQK